MKLLLLFFLLLCGWYTAVPAQSVRVNTAIIQLIDSAQKAFCENDTSKTIALLERISQLYPTDPMVVSTNKVLADLYLAKHQIAAAKARLIYAFTYMPTGNRFLLEKDTCGRRLNLSNNYGLAKADVCVALSQLYFGEKRFDSSGYYLRLADREYLPYQDCLNGVHSYQAFLSPYFADYYLAIGDRDKAIARLLDFFMNRDGDMVLIVRKLQAILLQHWTQKEIKRQVKKGLRQMKFTEAEDDRFRISLTLFGHTINSVGYGDRRHYKVMYRKNPGIIMLQEEKTAIGIW
ncbi:hypothetical protein SAMN05428949_2473 [Chitinophaga sp. YR627]|uniref:hypothetical protein n=1 Tax=Chitinophaga sp. YR627 TaxID=1881041 RepID=UPI0008EA9CD5|nr:hypothetical protein [Chitinophaga sp. YR627]SFN33578.1 hypothetical protein SAMN05428949_2473 [Chitinophaga sp. YR627]